MQTLIEQIQFIGYTSINPIMILIAVSLFFYMLGLIYLWISKIYLWIPKELVFLVSGLIQYVSIILITQHTLPYHQQIIWVQIAWFFAMWSQVDDMRNQMDTKVYLWIFEGIFVLTTFILFWNTANMFQSMIPLILWIIPFSVYHNFSKQRCTERKIFTYLTTTWVSGISLAIFTWLTV